jgi:iron complex outermembrane receptor protein
VQNVDAIRTLGLELAGAARRVGLPGLDLSGSLTYADSRIVRNDAFPASVGHWQPRVPRWRASLLAAHAIDERWSASLGARYSGMQYGTLDGSDPNGSAYSGFGRHFVADARVRVRLARGWSAAFGIDNLSDASYWAFHPYPQRTYSAELRYDL